jgi:hypothetical protein
VSLIKKRDLSQRFGQVSFLEKARLAWTSARIEGSAVPSDTGPGVPGLIAGKGDGPITRKTGPRDCLEAPVSW